MGMLILGLVLFLGAHSSRIFAEGARSAFIARRGEASWKLLYTAISLAGFVLIVWGYGAARLDPVVLWQPPVWTRHLASLLVLVAFVLLVAAYVPRNHFKARLRHPMVLSVKLWAFAHLVSNGTLADLLLFGSFLVWAVLDFRSARQRDRAGHGVPVAPAGPAGTLVTVVVGAIAWAAFAFQLHGWLIGVRPFG